MLTHEEFRKQMFEDPEFVAEYERLAPEFELLDEMIRAREEAGISQAEIARRMGTKPPAITRLMGAITDEKRSPSVATLRRYAAACGKKLTIRME